MLDITQDNFESEIAQGKVLVDFWAPWCSPCMQQLDILQNIKKPAYKICMVNVDDADNKVLARQHMVMGIPALLAFEDGKLLNRKSGVSNEADITAMFYQ